MLNNNIPKKSDNKYLLEVIANTQRELTEIFLRALQRDVITDIETITRMKDLIDGLKQVNNKSWE